MRRCTVCNNIMVEGYIHEEILEYFCSNACLDKHYPGQSVVQSTMSDDDLEDAVLYWTAWEDRIENVQAALEEIPEVDTEEEREALYSFISDNYKEFKNESGHAIPKQVWLIHDNVYFDEKFALLFEDGKEIVQEQWIVVGLAETVTEGACYHGLFDTKEDALEQIREDELECE